MNKEQFIKELKLLNITLTENQMSQLDNYYKLLISYNEKVNLTSIINEKDVYLKHFYDSLTLTKALDLNKKLSICDIGTGAGFPGIVLKICYPNLSITLVDSLEKRVKFLDLVISKLCLTDIRAIHSRIEDFKEYETFDIVVSRAVAKTNILLELGCQLPKKNGFFILMKGNVSLELETSKKVISTLNYKVDNVVNFYLPIENSERNIIILKKIKSTLLLYPREFSKIKKKPL